jgi:hypothetical protein
VPNIKKIIKINLVFLFLNTMLLGLGCGEVFPSGEEMLKHLSRSNHYEPSAKDWNQPQFYIL